MAYRKFAADNIFTGFDMLDGSHVLISDESGKIADLIEARDAGDDIEKLNGILSPGFINCHCHLELSHMKGMVPPGTGMVKFLLTVLGNRNHSPDKIAQAIADAENQMIENGIVAVGDICNTGDTIPLKQKENLRYHNLIETIGMAEAAAEIRFNQSLELMRRFPGKSSIVPHAPYSVSAKLMALINSNDPEGLLSIHNEESYAENELFEKGTGDFLELFQAVGADVAKWQPTGTTSIRSYLNKISGLHSMLLVHNTVTGTEDIDWIKTNNTSLPEIYWCVCPNANLYINNMLPDLHLLSGSGYKMVVGTDSLASNNQLDIIAELRTLQHYFPDLSIDEILRWATVSGAEALRINDQYGSFEKDKTPGIVLIENTTNRFTNHSKARRLL